MPLVYEDRAREGRRFIAASILPSVDDGAQYYMKKSNLKRSEPESITSSSPVLFGALQKFHAMGGPMRVRSHGRGSARGQ